MCPRSRGFAARSDRLTCGLLLCGVAAGPLFVVTFSIEGATRADYDALRHPVSSLALGPAGWVQTVNFLVAGVLFLAGATGLRRSQARETRTNRGALLIAGTVGLGLLLAGIFTTDPISGYPPGTPDVPVGRTTAGALHDLGGALTFLGLPAAALVHTRHFLRAGDRGWALYSAGTAVTMAAAFVLAGAGFSQVPSVVNVGGLFQRVSIMIGFAWLTALHAKAVAMTSAEQRSASNP